MKEITEQLLTSRIAEVSVPSRLGVKFTLEPMVNLMNDLDHPERKFLSVHVGGTSGKGSTATYIANILSAAGYRVGLFTKPHLSSVRERFAINGNTITAEELMELIELVSQHMNEKPTWFELTTALAFQYFHMHDVDLAVVEVGLGGKFDATNVILPEVSVLTNVGLDHTDILGDTVEEIAADKVGIIKTGKHVISGVTQPSVIKIVEDACSQSRSKLDLLGRDFFCANDELFRSGSKFSFTSSGEQYNEILLPSLGYHQVLNAALAISTANTLDKLGFNVNETTIRNGLAHTHIPGRMEIVDSNPILLLDGAHSPPKMASLAEAIRNLFPGVKTTAVLAFSEGHDFAATLGVIAPLLSQVILTNFDAISDYGSRHAQPPEILANLITHDFPHIKWVIEQDPLNAVALAKKLTQPEDLICVTGSIFLVGQVRPYLIGQEARTKV
jgi:dihydrofolate synthase/folylpolyglutamate synthase